MGHVICSILHTYCWLFMTLLQIELFKVVTLAAMVLALWHTVLLLQPKASLPNKALGIFLGVVTVPLVQGYCSLLGYSLPDTVTAFTHSLLLVYCPFLYLILKLMTRQAVPMALAAWHFAPFIIIGLYKATQAGQYPAALLLAAFFLHSLIYSVLSVRLLLQKRVLLGALLKQFKHGGYYWLLFLVLGLCGFIVLDLTIYALYTLGFGVNPLAWHAVLSLLAGYIVCVACLAQWLPYNSGQHEDELAEPVAKEAQVPISESTATAARNYELPPALACELKAHLQLLMQEQKLYRQNDLSLNGLAARVGITKHQLSELLNVHLGVSFYDYLNSLRAAEAAKKLRDKRCHLSILDIAFEVGFNNKNTFYRSFKAHTTMTPSAYRKQFAEQKTTTIAAA